MISPIEVEINDTTDIARSSSCFDLHLEIDGEGQLSTTLRKRKWLKCFHCEESIYMQHLHIEYIYIYIYFSVNKIFQILWFLSWLPHGLLLLIRKLLNERFLAVKLKSSLRKCYGGHHDLVKRYIFYVIQMMKDMFRLS